MLPSQDGVMNGQVGDAGRLLRDRRREYGDGSYMLAGRNVRRRDGGDCMIRSDLDREALFVFLMDRLRHLMQSRGLESEEIVAVTAQVNRIDSISPTDLVDYARELKTMRTSKVFAAVAEAYKRAKNIVEQSGVRSSDLTWRRHADRLKEPAELALRTALDQPRSPRRHRRGDHEGEGIQRRLRIP